MKHIEHGRSKMISNYGGVGSLIETQNYSVIIETFDNWGYKDLGTKLSEHVIKDDRLLIRLKARFPSLRYIVEVPTEVTSEVSPTANYFSKWFYCPSCKRFGSYNEMLTRWRSAGREADRFDPPKCSSANCRNVSLEQIRFVMTCKHGHIHDLPWKHWNTYLPEDNTAWDDQDGEDSSVKPQGPQIDLTKTCCSNQDLRFKISAENTDLTGIRVVCENCKKHRTLKGIFNFQTSCQGPKYWLGMTNGAWTSESCGQLSKVVVKSSNSIYYSNTLSSIYIPETQCPISNADRLIIDNMLDSGKFSKEQIVDIVSIQTKTSIDHIRNYLALGSGEYMPDNIFRQEEYRFLLKENTHVESEDLQFQVIPCVGKLRGIERLVMIERMKKITVQTSFTRQEPIDIDSILCTDDSYEYSVKRQAISRRNFETNILPGIESFGEGILFLFDSELLRIWEKQEAIIQRAEIIKCNANISSWQYHKIIARTLTPRKLLLHTFSHLLIRELEFFCGYPAASLQERLYVGEEMHGILVSAYDGTDGYLGGLSNLCYDLEGLDRIISSLLSRSFDCSSDPICKESQGQGVAKLNLAACHSCSLIPEISCELSNLFLDRELLVNPNFGYFKELMA